MINVNVKYIVLCREGRNIIFFGIFDNPEQATGLPGSMFCVGYKGATARITTWLREQGLDVDLNIKMIAKMLELARREIL